jgi:hypothetical protein
MATQLNLKNQAGKTFKSQLLLETSDPVADPMEVVAQSSVLALKPRLRWNETTNKWQFSNDGAAYTDIGGTVPSGSSFSIVAESTDLINGSAVINNGDLVLVVITEAYAAVTANKAAAYANIQNSNDATHYYIYCAPFTEDSFSKAVIWSQRIPSLTGPFLQLTADIPHPFFGDNTVISIVVGVAQNSVVVPGSSVAVSIGQNTFSVAGAANFNVGDFIFFDETDFIRKNNSFPFYTSNKIVFTDTIVLGPPPSVTYYAQAMLSSMPLDSGAIRSTEEFRDANIWGTDCTSIDSDLAIPGTPSLLSFAFSTDMSTMVVPPAPVFPGSLCTEVYMDAVKIRIRIYGIDNATGLLVSELYYIDGATPVIAPPGGFAIYHNLSATVFRKILFVMVSFDDANSVATGLYLSIWVDGAPPSGLLGFCRLKAPTTGASVASGNYYFGGVPIGGIYTESDPTTPNVLPFDDIDILPNPDPLAHTAIYMNLFQNIAVIDYPVGCQHCLVSRTAGAVLHHTLSAFTGDLFYPIGSYVDTVGIGPYIRQLSDVFMTPSAPAGEFPMFYSFAYLEDGVPYSLMMPTDYANMGVDIDTVASAKATVAMNDFALMAYLGYYGQGQIVGISGTDVTVNIFNPIGWYGYAGNFNFLYLLGMI